MAEKKNGEENTVDIKKLNDTLEKIAGGQEVLTNLPAVLGQMGQAIQGLVAKIESIAVDSSTNKDKTVKADVSVDDQTVDDMTGSQLTVHMMKEMKGMMEELIKPVTEKVDNAATNVHKTATETLLTKAVEDHEDFWQWKDEMLSLAKNNPSLTPERLYSLARGEDTSKADEIDKKIAEAKDKNDDGENKKKEPPFGGLTPTSGVSGMEGKTDMKFSDAASTAWDETMKDVAPEFIGGNA